mmetsp:Transcript_29261/g.33535  ORF Transcript_29261/g.33535 Transcript_29261/m.33535 type:complete len:119 (-) Transcript_29261:442-798(-)
MIITDSRVILTDDNSEENKSGKLVVQPSYNTFFIKDIMWIAYANQKKFGFLICVKQMPSLYLSTKKRTEVIDFLKMLYKFDTQKKLDVYSVPVKDLKDYQISWDDVEDDNYNPPEDKY